MSDFVNVFWSHFVTAIALGGILACALLLWLTARFRGPASADNTTGHVWDEDLREMNNPMPRWWMGLFVLTIVFGIGYLVVFPGLGSYRGTLAWSTQGEYEKAMDKADAELAPVYAAYSAQPVEKLATDAGAMAIGERLFLNNCAQCHGSDAGGSKGYPSLRDADWLYGGEPATISASITNGRNGVMPAFGASLGPQGVDNVVNYVRSLSALPVDSLKAQLGKPVFMANCAACHGADGKGNPALGAPNLADGIWLYGGSVAAVTETVTKGRGDAAAVVTRMPAHKDVLDAAKIQILTAYVWGLSNRGK